MRSSYYRMTVSTTYTETDEKRSRTKKLGVIFKPERIAKHPAFNCAKVRQARSQKPAV